MRRLCARPDCTDDATAIFTFDGAHAVVWIDALDGEPGPGEAGLCGFHATTLRAPLGWELHDRRQSPPPRQPSRPRREPAPRRERVRAARPTVVAVPLPFSETASAPPTHSAPAVRPAPSARPVLEASTPLLARAFRAAG
jgi:hypothetical protein